MFNNKIAKINEGIKDAFNKRAGMPAFIVGLLVFLSLAYCSTDKQAEFELVDTLKEHTVEGSVAAESSKVVFKDFSIGYLGDEPLKVYLLPTTITLDPLNLQEIGPLESKISADQSYTIPDGVKISDYAGVFIGNLDNYPEGIVRVALASWSAFSGSITPIPDLNIKGKLLKSVGCSLLGANNLVSLLTQDYQQFGGTKFIENLGVTPGKILEKDLKDIEKTAAREAQIASDTPVGDLKYSACAFEISYDLPYTADDTYLGAVGNKYRNKPIRASATVTIPITREGGNKPLKEPVPLIAVQHRTVFASGEAATELGLTDVREGELAEGIFDTMGNGYVAITTDSPGFGEGSCGKETTSGKCENIPVHPYLIRDSYPRDVMFAIRATKEFLLKGTGDAPSKDTLINQERIKLKDSLFLRGYSAGGFATLAIQRKIESDIFLRNEFKIVAVAAGAGPYDLLYTMSTLLENKAAQVKRGLNLVPVTSGTNGSLDSPSYIANMYYAYEQAYGWEPDNDKIFFKTDDSGDLQLRNLLINNRNINSDHEDNTDATACPGGITFEGAPKVDGEICETFETDQFQQNGFTQAMIEGGAPTTGGDHPFVKIQTGVAPSIDRANISKSRQSTRHALTHTVNGMSATIGLLQTINYFTGIGGPIPRALDKLFQSAVIIAFRNSENSESVISESTTPDKAIREFKKRLQENSVNSGWKPIAPLRLYHCKNDTVVPSGNTTERAVDLVGGNNILIDEHDDLDKNISGYVLDLKHKKQVKFTTSVDNFEKESDGVTPKFTDNKQLYSIQLALNQSQFLLHSGCPLYSRHIHGWFNKFKD